MAKREQIVQKIEPQAMQGGRGAVKNWKFISARAEEAKWTFSRLSFEKHLIEKRPSGKKWTKEEKHRKKYREAIKIIELHNCVPE